MDKWKLNYSWEEYLEAVYLSLFCQDIKYL